MPDMHFFLGTNGPDGFYSIYDELFSGQSAMIYILKGGPGCGKHGFLKKVGETASGKGLSVEYIHCPEDPDSLDAIMIPDLGVAFADGTAPHVIEPEYPGITGAYINLGEFYDTRALAGNLEEISGIKREACRLCVRANCLLKAAQCAESGLYESAITEELAASIKKRAAGIAAREFGGAKRVGGESFRFLSSHTCRGETFLHETVEASCGRVYLLDNGLGFADIMLKELRKAAVKSGNTVITCLCPSEPDKMEHLLIPGLSLGFISGTAGREYSRNVFRHIRLDAMADDVILSSERKSIRKGRKLSAMLYEEAYEYFSKVKKQHDRLEKIYGEHVDLEGVSALASDYCGLILGGR